MSNITIFSYGSNMCLNRIKARTPSAQPTAIGSLEAHRLLFHKAGTDGSAKADAFETGKQDDIVWGVLTEIATAEKPLLDQAEGLGNGYEEKKVVIRTQQGLVKALLYETHPDYIDNSLKPFFWYRDFVLQGAKENALPHWYIDQLKEVECIYDDNVERRLNNAKILSGV